MRILIIKGSSQYGGTRLFADSAAEAFRRAAHFVEVLDLEGSSDARALLNAHAQTCEADLVFSIAILGEYRNPEGLSISRLYQAPHVLWHVDYILGQSARLSATPESTALLFIDPTQVDAVKAMCGPDRFRSLGFFPHPAVGTPAPDDADPEAFAANREIQVLWSGSYQKPVAWTGAPPHLLKPLREALDMAMSTEWIAPHEAVIRACQARGVDITSPANRGSLRYAAYVDDMVRKTRRIEFMKAVAKTGAPIHICGVGWEPHLYRFKNATHHGPVSMTRVVELMRRSRVVLNANVNFGAGSHERPFSASMAGAATFSDHSRYYEQAFAPGEIELYRWKTLPAGMEALKALIGDPVRCFQMARAAKARTLAEHTWDRRIRLILDAAASVAPIGVS